MFLSITICNCCKCLWW